MDQTKSIVLQGTDLLRVTLNSFNLEEIEAHIKAVDDVMMELEAADGRPGFMSVTARISAGFLLKQLRVHLAEAVSIREMLQCDEAARADEEAETTTESFGNVLAKRRIRAR